MTNSKTTKRALLSSAVALIICFTMLLGTTFAWFTDSVSTNVNTIQSGNLDVELYHSNFTTSVKDAEAKGIIANGFGFYGTETDEYRVESNTKLFLNEDGEKMLWEPGATSVETFRIKNNGTLALKYQFKVDFLNATETAEGNTLADIINISADALGYMDNGVSYGISGAAAELADRKLADGSYLFEGYLLPGENYDFWVGLQWVSSEDDNLYNVEGGLSINVGVNLVATQYTYEKDNYVGDQYDAGATFPVVETPTFVSTKDELSTALASGESNIALTADVDYGDVTLGELTDVVINGADGASIILKTDANSKLENVTIMNVNAEYTGDTADCGIVINAEAEIDNLVVDGCTFTGTGAKAGRGLSGYNNNATIVLKNCTFKDIGYPIYAWGGYESLTIDNCTFDNIKSWAIMPQSGFDGDLTVNKCKFVNCLGGGLIKAGTLTEGHTFTFTNNTITGCTIAGDHNWFQFNTSAGTTVISGNVKDGVEWIPTEANGLK